eukprot:scaffold65196_cov24-Phaeocystis_antarctica.AAC.1
MAKAYHDLRHDLGALLVVERASDLHVLEHLQGVIDAGLQAGSMGLQAGSTGLQAGSMGLQADAP